jgi:hypothetical protein
MADDPTRANDKKSPSQESQFQDSQSHPAQNPNPGGSEQPFEQRPLTKKK